MLDGRVLGASQVEYKPFGKPPLKREIQHKWHQFNTSATCACVHIPVARLARHRSLPGRATCPALKPRQAAEPPLSPGSLLHALNFNMSEYMSDEHVLGTPGAPPCRAKPLNLHSSRVPCYMCYMCYILHAKPPNLHSPPGPCYMCYMCYILHAKPRNPHSFYRVLAICAICAISYTPSR